MIAPSDLEMPEWNSDSNSTTDVPEGVSGAPTNDSLDDSDSLVADPLPDFSTEQDRSDAIPLEELPPQIDVIDTSESAAVVAGPADDTLKASNDAVVEAPEALAVDDTLKASNDAVVEAPEALAEREEVPQQSFESPLETTTPNLMAISPTVEVSLGARNLEDEYLDELPGEVEMSLFEHLEELRQRIFYSLIAVFVGIVGCFLVVKPIVQLLEIPARGVKFLQLAPGEYFFVSLKVAGYSGLLLASPFIMYQIVRFVLPGLTRRERQLLVPIFLGSSVLFLGGLAFAYIALIPAALNFFVSYGADVVEQLWSIDRYFEFVLLLMFSTGLAFQIPVIQLLLGLLGIVSSKQMLSGWRYVILGAAVLGAVLTPSTDPLTQTLLAGAVLGLYFSGIGFVKLIGR